MIHKLSTEVVNQIAAGQVVQRPYNAIKQLVQNSIDAGSTKINIFIQAGGMKKIQIKDNGRGIFLQDFPLLCERYATSKIKSVADLQSISSFGFRGQALASLTHVGQVQVISRHQNYQQAYYAKYDKQKLISQPIKAKREIGTTITIQNLFSMLASRRKSLSAGQQKKMIKQLIYQIALDYPYIQFSLSTQKGPQAEIDNRSLGQDEARLNIYCQLTGILKQNCILQRLQAKDSTKILGIFSKLNTWNGHRRFTISINHRIVDSPSIQKIIQKAYDQANRTVHKQNYSFCCYINIKIDSKKIDCNVHPTKKQINFYKSSDLFAEIQQWMENLLQQSGTMKYLDTNIKLSQRSLFQLQNKLKQKIPFDGQNSFSSKRAGQIKSQQVQGRQKMIVQNNYENQDNSRRFSNSQNFRNINQQSLKQQNYQSQRRIPQKTYETLKKTSQNQPQYDNNRTRTDSKQLPLQYFYKNLILQNSNQQSSSQKHSRKIKNQDQIIEQQNHQKYFIFKSYQQTSDQKFNKIKQNAQIKNFIMSITYVGCFNSSIIFIQAGNKLFSFGITQFVRVYVKEILKQKRQLYLRRLKKEKFISVSEILEKFLAQNEMQIGKQKANSIYNTTLQQLGMNRDLLENKYAIKVNEFMQLVSYPIVQKVFQHQPLKQQSLSYFLMHLFAHKQLQFKQDIQNLYIQFLGDPFYADQITKCQKSVYSDKYDNFFRNEFIPTLKLKGKFPQTEFENLQLGDLLAEMMDLRDAYRMFQRC